MNPSDAYLAARELQLISRGRLDVVFHGTSMEPLLVEGDEVLVEPIDGADARVGDIVVYRDADRFPTRRVVGVDRAGLTLWCDAWPDRRYRASHEDVLGRAVARTRDGHRLEADTTEWRSRRESALRTYRRVRPRLELRRIRRGLRRRLRHLLRLG